MNANLKKTEASFIFNGKKKEFLDWLESLRISKYWLDTMNSEDSYGLFREIYQVLKNFKQIDLEEKEKLFSLMEIDSCLQGAYKKVQDSYLETKFPLNKKLQEIITLVIATYMELANAYYNVLLESKSKKHKLSEQHQALTACKGLQGLGQAFLTAAQLYSYPPKDFWLLCFRLFSAAEEMSLLDNKVKIDNAIYSAAILFKRLIIFYILDKNQFSPQEIEIIFQSLLKGINYIQSYISAMADVKKGSATKIYGFSVDKDEAPSIHNNVSPATAKLLRYVEKSEIVKIMQFLCHEAKVAKSENSDNSELFSRILLTLEYKKHEHQTRIHKQHSCRAIVGIDNLVDFLLEIEGKVQSSEHKKQFQEHEQDHDGFQLRLDSEFEKEIRDSPVIENLHIIDSNMGGYGVSWNQNVMEKLQIGEVIGILPDFNAAKKRIEIGLIKRIKITGENLILGVKIIALEATLIYIERANAATAGEWVLFLFGSPDYDVGVLCHKERNYQVGEVIFVQLAEKKADCYLGPLLNSTPLIEHITLCY